MTSLLRSAPAARALGTMVLAAALLSGCGDDTEPSKRSGTETDPPSSASTDATTKAPSAAAPSYLAEGAWHRPDGSEVALPDNPFPYDEAVAWGDLLVASRWDGEVFGIADVIDADGKVVDSFRTAGSVVVDDARSTIAWIDPESGRLMTRWDDGEVAMAELDLSAAGDGVRQDPVAITGGPDCHEAVDGCIVYVNDQGSGTEDGEEPHPTAYDSHGIDDTPVDALYVNDVGDDLIATLDSIDESEPGSCGSLYELGETGAEQRWSTCDHRLHDIAPGGGQVAGVTPTYASGIGDSEVAILSADDGSVVSSYRAPDDGHIAGWAWTDEESLLVVAWTGREWALTQVGRTDPLLTLSGEPEQTPIVLVR